MMLYEDQEREIFVKMRNEEIMTADGYTLRGYRLEYICPEATKRERSRIILYMHGTRVYLPRKLYFLS